MLKGIETIGMLLMSNVFMTFAWYGHLKLQEIHWNHFAAFGCLVLAVFFAFLK